MNREFHTAEPFTVALCMHCSSSGPGPLLTRLLRNVVRRCPHGVLVSTQCLLGEFTCATRRTALRPVLVVQPCSADRIPSAPAIWIGPIVTDADAHDACSWVAAGRWDGANLPAHLRADVNLARVSSHN
ncbi:hypothetical protein [Mycolicibacterium sp. HK-90]|uniref:hypothetical protein n=1 Tax=Mycolicibacterium sp. HK-90 TaxID=3056937 RepID=UPI00265B528E|nr:hypothetical protein [Mycolicibacterium sp. HK-90]WKG02927.1 hypothetical protein QU592_27670 [Mycolicibacterium sp. HK-90]